MSENILEIIYQDDHLVAINKPHGLLVHRSPIAADATEFAMQLLRDQIGQYVYPCHRLDRKTSGVLLFALDKDTQSNVNQWFREQKISKEYLAIIRGWTDDKIHIDYDLTNDRGIVQGAITDLKTIQRCEIGVPLGKYATQRYSLVALTPTTGRFHQLRKHMNHIRHPIIGDRPHGCSKQNRLWKSNWGMEKMMLHAQKLRIPSPIDLTITANISDEFKRVLDILQMQLPRNHNKMIR